MGHMRMHCILLVAAFVFTCSSANIRFPDHRFKFKVRSAIEKAVERLAKEKKTNMNMLEAGVDTKKPNSASGKLGLETAEEGEAFNLDESAFIVETATNILKRRHGISPDDITSKGKRLKIWRKEIKKYCYQKRIICNKHAKYRTADGSCNNLKNPHWGKSFEREERFLEAKYDDGMGSARKKSVIDGRNLPSARRISNILFRGRSNEKDIRAKNQSGLVMTFGQFIDHELGKTPTIKGSEGSSINCCDTKAKNRDACIPIKVPRNDPFFKVKCLNLVRSAAAPRRYCDPGRREQTNELTAYIDGSAVYGSTKRETIKLRSFINGRLKTRGNNLPPKNDDKDSCIRTTPKDKCFLVGDGRGNEQPALSTIHILFMREHNRLAGELKKINQRWKDEKLFQESRKILGAIIQHITYTEFLPTFLNGKLMSDYHLNVYSYPGARNPVYNPNINAGLRNSFLAAAYRVGHTLIPEHLTYQFANKTKRTLELTEAFFRPHLVQTNNAFALPAFARGLTSEHVGKSDRIFVDAVRDKLFIDKQGKSFDLPAINIKRGRDHGLPSYNDFRKFCNLPRARHFGVHHGGLVNHSSSTAELLKKAYRNVDDIELYPGGVSEKPLPGAIVGPTFGCLIAKQFQLLKAGDRFWFENVQSKTGFSPAQIKQIKRVTMAKLLCTNFGMKTIRENPFRVQGRIVKCRELHKMNLEPWREW